MAYGIDQCRICGIDIPFVGPKGAQKQEEANRRPMLPEKEWRRRGYLASPTRAQLGGAPAEGCCHQCGLKQMEKSFKYRTRTLSLLAFAVALAAFVVWVITYLPH
jgi:hypothetical protein